MMADTENSRELRVNVVEQIGVTDAVTARLVPTKGFVAILDALGTKLLSIEEAIRFVSLRDSIMDFTKRFAEQRLRDLDMSRLKTFTLNDTIIFSFEISGEVSVKDINNFCHVLRIAETRSIIEAFPFRGAFAIGGFFVGDERTIWVQPSVTPPRGTTRPTGSGSTPRHMPRWRSMPCWSRLRVRT